MTPCANKRLQSWREAISLISAAPSPQPWLPIDISDGGEWMESERASPSSGRRHGVIKTKSSVSDMVLRGEVLMAVLRFVMLH
jgi:hypothetical protein